MGDFNAFIKEASDWLRSQDTGGYVANPPMTQTAAAHAITIKSQRGVRIGRIQSWSPNMARTVDSVFEVQAACTGEPHSRVPQTQGTNSISVERYELYTTHLGEAFGVPVRNEGGGNTVGDMYSLIQQLNPFNVREVWRDPFGGIRAYVYVNCYFSNMGTTIAANDDRIVRVRATLEFTRRLRLS